MSGCQRIAEHLGGYRDGELGFLRRWRVERHVTACGDCQRDLEALGRTGEWVRQAAMVAEPDFWADIAPRLPALDAARRAEPAERSRSGFGGLFGPILGGAVAATAAALLWVALPTPEPAASGVVRALYSQGRPVVVLEEEGLDTIIWVMDDGAGADRSGAEEDHVRV